jgi:hypothetical protein
LGEAFGEPLTAERQAIYASSLSDIPPDDLRLAIRRAIKELKWFPKVAELRELACASSIGSDGRPGPEEAWASMPKGERMEDDSVVWCEEERIAYGACRSLLLEGDLIGARMAFKERYEKELADAHSEGRAVHWSMSAGYDVEHRLSTLATAIEQKRLTLESALKFVSAERRDDFARMLPPSQAKGLLTGEVRSLPNIPGLAGVLAGMQMDGTLPEEFKAAPSVPERSPADHTPEGIRARREELKAQIELLKRSRKGSGAT